MSSFRGRGSRGRGRGRGNYKSHQDRFEQEDTEWSRKVRENRDVVKLG